jgi:hypothetical protein
VTPIETTIFDAEGLINIGQAGIYPIDSSEADDPPTIHLSKSKGAVIAPWR